MRVTVVCVVAVVLGMIGTAAAEVPIACVQPVPDPTLDLNLQLRTGLPAEDYLDFLWRCQHAAMGSQTLSAPPGAGQLMPPPQQVTPPPPRPRSQWIEADRAAHVVAVGKSAAAVLVVPFQVQGFGIDRVERALMTADLAYEFGQSTTVADPFLVSRALGEGRRRIPSIDIMDLAAKTKAKFVVFGYVGHEQRKTMTVTIRVLELKDGKIAAERQKDWVALPFTVDDPPFLVFHRLLPQIIRETAIVPPATRAVAAEPKEFVSRVSLSPQALMQGANSKMPSMQAALLLAAVAPPNAELSNERLNERALLATMRSGSTGPLSRFVQAYALMNLDFRPCALRTLQGLSQPRDRALVALLNGNFPAAERARGEIANTFERLLIDIRLQDLRKQYNRQGEPDLSYVSEMFGDTIQDWGAMLAARFASADPWIVQDADEIKKALDQVFPISEFNYEARLKGNAVLLRNNAYDDIALDVTSARHMRRIIEQSTTTVCCKPASLQPQSSDVLTLIEGQLETRLTKRFYLATAMQGLPERAIADIQQYAPYFTGNLALETARAHAALGLYNKAANGTRESWSQMVTASALLVANHSHGQNYQSRTAVVALGVPAQESMNLVDAYGYDFPRRSYWPMWFIRVERNQDKLAGLLRESLDFSQSQIEAAQYLLPMMSNKERSSLTAQLRERFIGFPNRASYIAGDDASSVAIDRKTQLRSAIADDPADWDNYEALAKLLFAEGDFNAAAKAYLSFPGFKQAGNDRIRLSNLAYSAGTEFYWKGQPDLAIQLFNIAANLKTGSEGSIASKIKLQILAGDFVAATDGSIARAKRYNGNYAYRDYLSFLHALGQGKDAWLGFSQITSTFELPGAWESALVGHRKDGANEAAVRKWLRDPGIRSAAYEERKFAPWFAILANSVDRMPPPDLATLVAELDGAPRAMVDARGYLYVPYTFGASGAKIIKPSALRMGKSPNPPEGSLVKSELVYFSEAYSLLRRGQFGNSAAVFAAMADRYPVEGDYSFALGYFAYAAAKSGDQYGLEKFLGANAQLGEFDHLLANAIFAGAKKDTAAALAELKKAVIKLPFTEYRPILAEYQFAETCEWLYIETGDKRFLQPLLEWVKAQQRIQPTNAWAYAMQYTYETEPNARLRALAMTLYLDRLSPRITKASAAELAKAQAWLNDHNPFNSGTAKSSVVASLH